MKFQGKKVAAKASEYVQLPHLAKFGAFEEEFDAGCDTDFLEHNYLNHPVVHLNFSHVKGRTYEEVLHYFLHKIIKPEFERHFVKRGLLSKLDREKRAERSPSLKAVIQRRMQIWTKYE